MEHREDEFEGHTGRLELDSPSLHRRLRVRFDPETVASISNTYRLVAQFGGLDEGFVYRARGVRYNPKPARICEIILKECRGTSAEGLTTALVACLPETAIPTDHVDALNVRKLLNNPSALPPKPEVESVALALLLDEARHLHMAAASTDLRVALSNKVRLVLLSESPGSPNHRLYRLLEFWLKRTDKAPKATDLTSLPGTS